MITNNDGVVMMVEGMNDDDCRGIMRMGRRSDYENRKMMLEMLLYET